MVEGQDLPLAHALDVELTHFLRFLAEVPDADEGYRAYVEDRPPVWS
jgi:enoyl-CoA hydratase/carnithine racemase